MPGANARALEKSRTLAADVLVLDLEDAVAPDAKVLARTQVAAAVAAGGYGRREVVVRINALDTPWGADDLAAIAGLPVDAVLVPKVEAAAEVDAVAARLGGRVPVWIMVETPRAVLSLERIVAEAPAAAVLVMGTSDLVKALRARHTVARTEVLHALATCVAVARAFDRTALDGVHLDFRNETTFRAACVQARDLGFDGKTLIHPSQVDIANTVFAPSAEEIADAGRVIAVWQDAQRQGKGVAVLDGRLIESLHVAEAERVLAFAAVLAAADA
jgi:citrate lyase subunit beta/citryl-CoA lyase